MSEPEIHPSIPEIVTAGADLSISYNDIEKKDQIGESTSAIVYQGDVIYDGFLEGLLLKKLSLRTRSKQRCLKNSKKRPKLGQV